ncbi:MAG: hypothetical protein LUH51_06180 [Firmicutes bacterium]|nr:hypothetical protein [Bacillota bacterium]
MFKKIIAMLLVLVLAVGTFSGCVTRVTTSTDDGSSSTDLITLTCYSQLANWSGLMVGWFATILAEKFGVQINIVPDTDGVFATRMENKNLGDIVVWGSDGDQYSQAIAAGLLLDWEQDDLLQTYGAYMWETMQDAFEKNKTVSAEKDDEGNIIGDADTIYGFAANVASSSESTDSFFYTWDIRWDLYAELGYPECNDLDDLLEILTDMQALEPTDDNGNKTYAVSLWPDWDGNMVMYVKSLASAYYGYDGDFPGLGHYDPATGEYYDPLSEGSPYLEMLAWFNQLYQRGLLDPDSMTQTYDKMIEKVQNGGTLFSIFNYSGYLAYNNDTHAALNKVMKSLTPTEASPIVEGLSTLGGNRIWSIGSTTQYPELCMEIINWLCTPEGRLTIDYGPQGLCWDYDENNKTYLTEFGQLCVTDRTTIMPDEWGGQTFNDGSFQINNTTWASGDINPVSGEPYDYTMWASQVSGTASCDAEQDWRDYTDCVTIQEYMLSGNYTVDYPTTYSATEKSDELTLIWNEVTDCICTYSWQAIYASTDEEFNAIVSEMRGKAMQYGYQQCVAWCEQEVAIKDALQEPLRSSD